MALQNYARQKNALSLLDVFRLEDYARALNTCARGLDGAWSGNSDKQLLFQAIQRQLADINKLRQNMNWVQKAAQFLLDKMNELGELTGFAQPWIPNLADIAFAGGGGSSTRIKMNTGAVRGCGDALNAKRGCLSDCQSDLNRALQTVDSMLLGMWDIGGSLRGAQSSMDCLLARHDRIVAVLRQTAEVYEAADRRIDKRNWYCC